MAQEFPGGVTADDVREIWRDQLRPVPPNLINPRLSTPSREFLASVGLPTIEVQEWDPVDQRRLLETAAYGGREFVVIAESYDGAQRCGIDLATDEVTYLASRPENSCLLNSTVALFVLFLGIFQRTVLELTKTDEDTLVDAVHAVWSQLEIRDPRALDQENYWQPILDQVASEWE